VSGARRYLAVFFATALLLTAAVCGFNWYGFSQGYADFAEARLLRAQLDKLEAAERIDVLLLGDSSLGNAVDPQAWSRALGRDVLALPLAGYFGFEGTRNLLRRVLRRHRPELVVLMQTIELPSRALAPEGALLTAETWSDVEGAGPFDVIEHFMPLPITTGILRRWLWGAPEERQPAPSPQGYVPQAVEAAEDRQAWEDQRELQPEDLKEETFALVEEIGRTCVAAGVRCLYLHGPYLEPACSNARDYLTLLNRRIEAVGLEVVAGTPLCLTLEETGDQPDHVTPAELPRFSQAYLDLVIEEDRRRAQLR
jgi:hypothetical protein